MIHPHPLDPPAARLLGWLGVTHMTLGLKVIAAGIRMFPAPFML